MQKNVCIMLGLAFLSGCATTSSVNKNKPEPRPVIVQANELWQPSGIYVRQGEIIHCRPEGVWQDNFAEFGPEGNPEIIKSHLGVSAPANSLLMKISNQTNLTHYAGQETNIAAQSSGELLFRKNFSLPIGMTGSITVMVTVAADADGDGVSDYDEINIWKTNPLHPDSDGDGFTDFAEIMDLLYPDSVPRQ